MIRIQPLDISWLHDGRIDSPKIDRHPGERLKAQKTPVLIFYVRYGHEDRLRSDSIFILYIDPRFIRYDHARLKDSVSLSRYRSPANALRSLVDIQNVADPVSGSVIIIDRMFPERHSCAGIQQDSCRSVKESCVQKIQVCDHDQREIPLLSVGQRSAYNRPGHICRPAEILSAGIHKVKALGSDLRTVLLRSRIVRHRRVRAVSGDRRK